MGVRQIYFDMVFLDVRVDPREDVLLRVKENHILIDDEVTVVLG